VAYATQALATLTALRLQLLGEGPFVLTKNFAYLVHLHLRSDRWLEPSVSVLAPAVVELLITRLGRRELD
jgi:hypothetical protein